MYPLESESFWSDALGFMLGSEIQANCRQRDWASLFLYNYSCAQALLWETVLTLQADRRWDVGHHCCAIFWCYSAVQRGRQGCTKLRSRYRKFEVSQFARRKDEEYDREVMGWNPDANVGKEVDHALPSRDFWQIATSLLQVHWRQALAHLQHHKQGGVLHFEGWGKIRDQEK